MNIEISGRNYEVKDKVKKLISTKIEKIRKYFDDIIDIRCVLKVEKKRHICEIHVHGKNLDVDSTQSADTMDEAIQSTIDHLKRQAQKNRTKIIFEKVNFDAKIDPSYFTKQALKRYSR